MANAFKIKQGEQKKEVARSELLRASRGGLTGREQAIKTYCQQTGSTRDHALNILASNSSPVPDFGRMFERG